MRRPPLPRPLRAARALSALLSLPCAFMLLAVPLRRLSAEEWISLGVVAALLVGSVLTAVGLTRRRRIGWDAGVAVGALAALTLLARLGSLWALWRGEGVARASAALAGGTYAGLVVVGLLCLSARRWRAARPDGAAQPRV